MVKRIRIVRCSDFNYWYANKIGAVVEVTGVSYNSYDVTIPKCGTGRVLFRDCEVMEYSCERDSVDKKYIAILEAENKRLGGALLRAYEEIDAFKYPKNV